MNGQLFTQDFLARGIASSPVWAALTDAQLDAFIEALRSVYAPYSASSELNEAITESEIIVKVLAQLGWSDLWLPQVTASGARREDVPDFLLYPDEVAKVHSLKEKRDDRRYRRGIAILEAKRWMRVLDRGDATDRLGPGTPSNQILRYLSAADVASDRAVRWGVLTNGAIWRLYYQGARSRSEDFLEIDLAAALGVSGTQPERLPKDIAARHVLKTFFCFFHRAAFLPQSWDVEKRTFHEYALAETRQYEERVSDDLGQRVFGTVFPDLADALASGDPSAKTPYERHYLDEVREAALILLYRLLFVLYAEDRELLPVRDKRYGGYSLRRLREEVSAKRDASFLYSSSASRLWDELTNLFRAIANGDKSLGLPAYNGGLFDDTRTPILARAKVPDARLAPVIDELSRRADLLRAWINYRDLSVQHLGSIYERLLEYRLEPQGGRLIARPNSFARRGSGSYYTHDDLVKVLIAETVGPLTAERVMAFDALIADWKGKKELKPLDWVKLDGTDPASRVLELRVCDPAMGSGHFLVALVDDLADRILESMSHAAELVADQRWAKNISNAWVSPVAVRIADIRRRILAVSKAQGWAVEEAQLDDRHVVRRMILKRVIHGVDKNPMAVELAKVALWLHTFTVGAPLSFLDHHLRCGDALFGGRMHQLKDELGKLAGGLLQQDDLRRVEAARLTMEAIGDLTDIDIAEAHQSKALMDQIEDSLRPQARALDFLQARRWASAADAKDYEQTWVELLNHEYGDNLLESIELLSKRGIKLGSERQKRAHRIAQAARARAQQVRFLHWELAFPTVWPGAGYGERGGGFDAVIGNPPWDRMKLQEVEWFAERRPEIAKAVRASDRKHLIAALKTESDPLWQEYLAAKEFAETAIDVARSCGDYPLLSGGDVNLYSLFVERAQALIHSNGIVGLLTPSGIAADKGAAEFFRGISGTGRLRCLYDFENKKVFFPDIHASFKFSTLVFGGETRVFTRAQCAFYLHSVDQLKDSGRLLSLGPEDFLSVNPNTGAAPVFRTRRDAEITTTIYRRQPVLVDRRPEAKKLPPTRVWPARYLRMFDMTTDSKLFRRRDELKTDGWYPVEGNRWKKGNAEALPLYEGKMVQMYDHRAANIVVHSDNVHRAAQQEAVNLQHHQDPKFFPSPQFFVHRSDIDKVEKSDWAIAFKLITATTNMRTMISAILPKCAIGNSMGMLLPEAEAQEMYAEWGPLLQANIASFALDYCLRQKVQGQNINWYMVEQLPLIRPAQFAAKLGEQKIGDFVRDEVLRLSYTAWDLQPFARELGYGGNPFEWDEEDRRHRIARLDALFFHLYGIKRDDAEYILETFPIVREQDEKAHGRFLTKDLVLAYLNAVEAGDLKTRVSV
jgi:hypothetical protein